ncbi:tail completion protein gp17 [Singulisphaera sp. PoT]|uniref:tail completion protein gp17 n=1 Tax=Singulisphaera sp. PoT TaxID=3411797 RepID=UPI003BF582F5
MPLPPIAVIIRRGQPPAPIPRVPGPLPAFLLALRRRIAANIPTIYPTFLDALVATLERDPELSAIVGRRIFPDFVPQGQPYPALVYQIISDVPGSNLDGRDKTFRSRVQFKSYARSRSACTELFLALERRFNGFQGRLGGIGGIEVTEAIIPDASSNYTPQVDGSDQGTFMVPADIFFSYRSRF